MVPFGRISMMRFATVSRSWKSWDVKMRQSVNVSRPLLRAEMDSRSRWSVGSSNIRKLPSANIILENMPRAFSPPDRTVTLLLTSSPEKSMRPRKPLINCMSVWSVYWLSQSSKGIFVVKYAELSLGK